MAFGCLKADLCLILNMVISPVQAPSFLFVCCFCFFEAGFPLCISGCPGTHSLDQAGLEITEIHLPLPP